jgi:hypothetical protein
VKKCSFKFFQSLYLFNNILFISDFHLISFVNTTSIVFLILSQKCFFNIEIESLFFKFLIWNILKIFKSKSLLIIFVFSTQSEVILESITDALFKGFSEELLGFTIIL